MMFFPFFYFYVISSSVLLSLYQNDTTGVFKWNDPTKPHKIGLIRNLIDRKPFYNAFFGQGIRNPNDLIWHNSELANPIGLDLPSIENNYLHFYNHNTHNGTLKNSQNDGKDCNPIFTIDDLINLKGASEEMKIFAEKGKKNDNSNICI